MCAYVFIFLSLVHRLNIFFLFPSIYNPIIIIQFIYVLPGQCLSVPFTCCSSILLGDISIQVFIHFWIFLTYLCHFITYFANLSHDMLKNRSILFLYQHDDCFPALIFTWWLSFVSFVLRKKKSCPESSLISSKLLLYDRGKDWLFVTCRVFHLSFWKTFVQRIHPQCNWLTMLV